MTRRGYDRKSIFHLLALAGVLVFSTTAYGQDATEADDEDAAELQKVAVTGSRIKRTELEGPAPVYIIDQEDMAQRGYVTVFEALDDLTINNGFVFEGPEADLFTPDVQTINLRSFGVGTTLVLVNGRRLTNYPAAYQSSDTVFNFGSIPTAAVERIEILATGASAIYGSDAVAGVINIVLRQDLDDTIVNVLWGTPTETKSFSDGQEYRVQLLTGQTFERGNYTFTFEYSDRDAIRGHMYDQYDSDLDYPVVPGEAQKDLTLYGLDNWAFFFFPPPSLIDPRDATGIANLDQACAAVSPQFEGWTRGAGLSQTSLRGSYCADPNNGSPAINFRNEKEAYSAYFNGNLEVGDRGTELFTDLFYYSSESTQDREGVPIFTDINDPNGVDPIFGVFGDWWSIQRKFSDQELGNPAPNTFEDTAWTISVGARGVWNDLHDWEFSINQSDYEYTQTRLWATWDGVINNFFGTYLGLSLTGVDWWSGGTLGEDIAFGLAPFENLFQPIPASVVNDVFDFQTYKNETSDTFVSFQVSGDLLEMNTGPLQYAFVAEYEDEDFQFVPDALIQQDPPAFDSEGNPIPGRLAGSGWYNLTGYQGGGDRQRWAVGGELRVPLHETLTLNLAGRFDDYDSGSTSFGSDFTPSGSIEWRPTTDLLVRAGYTESFRAPDLVQVFVSTGFFTADLDQVSCYQTYLATEGLTPDDLSPIDFENMGLLDTECTTTSTFAHRRGAQDLGPDEEPLDAETGNSWWYGFSWEVLENLTLTADFVHIELEDRVITEDTQDILDVEWECFKGTVTGGQCDAAANRIIRQEDPTTGIEFIKEFNVSPINQFFEEVDSIDITAEYTLNTDYGLFNFTGDYSHILSHEQKLTPDSEPVNLRDDPVLGGWDFRGSFVGTVTYSYGDFSTTATMVRRGGITPWRRFDNITGEDTFAAGRRLDSYITWNWTGQYNWTDDFMTRIRVVNVFDEEPPFDATMDFSDEPWYNYFLYAGAGIGRQLFVEGQYTF